MLVDEEVVDGDEAGEESQDSPKEDEEPKEGEEGASEEAKGEESGEEKPESAPEWFAAYALKQEQRLANLKSSIEDGKTPPPKGSDEVDMDKPLSRREYEAIKRRDAEFSAQEQMGRDIFSAAETLKAELPGIFQEYSDDARGNTVTKFKGINREVLAFLDEVDNNPALLFEIVARHKLGKGKASPAKKRPAGAKVDAGTGKSGAEAKRPEDMTVKEILDK